MHVEKIEITGFKSFADRTVFDLHPGITAVVGPNGCGKSNIVDAFKWVLGEQSAKSLRGGSMEDVIFFGSATKKSKGMAEVTLVLSDIDEHPSGDNNGGSSSGQITVTRRLYRSGESGYLLNKTPCRLKDIKDVLLDTGLELKAYSILEQGRINHILSSKPQDRRFLIEEVAGVMKYKVRKAEAIRKLESSKANLQRLSDIISEIKRQINAIDRHAKKAERYKKIFDEVKGIDLKVGKREFAALKNLLSDLASSENTLKEREAEASARIHSSEAMIEEKRRSCTDSEKLLGESRSEFHLFEKEVTESEGEMALLKRDCENLRERIRLLQVQDEESLSKRAETIVQIEDIEAEGVLINKNLTELNLLLDEKDKALSAASEEALTLDDSLESFRKELFTRAEETSSIKNIMSQISVMIDNISHKTEKNTEDVSSVRNNLRSVEDVILDTKNKLAGAEGGLQESKRLKEESVKELDMKKTALSSSEEKLYKDREELAALVSKQESLKELQAGSRSSISESIKILSQISDIFDAPPEYETALEAILGDKLNASVVENRGDLVRALGHIKNEKIKRTGLISVDNAESNHTAASHNRYQNASGVIGRAIDFIKVKQDFSSIAETLLSDVVMVDRIETAFSFWSDPSYKNDPYPAYYVTLSGEVLEPSGIVFAGTEKGVLKVKRKIKELGDAIDGKKESISVSERVISELKAEMIRLENRIISLDGEISEKEKYRHELQVKLSSMDEENARHQRKLEFLSVEADEGRNELETLEKSFNEKKQEVEILEGKRADTEEKIASMQGAIADRKNILDSLRSELTDVKLQQTSIKEKAVSSEREKERLHNVVSDIDTRKSETLFELEEMEKLIGHKELDVAQIQEGLKGKVLRIEGVKVEISRIEEMLEAKTSEVAILEKQQKSYSSELDDIRKELGNIEVKKTESTMKHDYLREDMRKEYAVDLDILEVDGDLTEEEEEKLPELKQKLQSIGQVNLGTLDEYEELKTRYEFMSKQQDDVVTAINTLESTISKINRSTKQRLKDAFEELNEKFKEVFTMLFGNGKAELILTEEDILEAGIEIVAQPPGKRLKNLLALSGGEQALTTLSLLFAGFMVKPTPVCILDEVDAPLDESNTGRFIKLLSELSNDIQFVSITHNRLTMEAADYIYGITMEEPGASKVVSMHMADTV